MMANSNGWEQVKSFIEENMKPLENSLFNDDLDREDFKVKQASRQAFKTVIDFVERRVGEVVKNI